MFDFVDLGYLESISGGDKNFQKEMINIFLKQIPGFLDNMRLYLSRNDNEKLMKEAHTAKSSALVFMMEDTGNVLKEIKLLAENNQTEKIPAMIDRVEVAFNGALHELTEYLQKG